MMHDICFWYLPMYVAFAKIWACVRNHVWRFYSNCRTLQHIVKCSILVMAGFIDLSLTIIVIVEMFAIFLI